MKTVMKKEGMTGYHPGSRGSSKLCFSAQKILFVLKNRLAPVLKPGVLRLPPKSAAGVKIQK